MIAFFLMMPISMIKPDKTVDIELHVKDGQRQQAAEGGGGQSRQNRDGVDEAFVEDAENQVNHEDGHDQQNAESAERFLEGLRAALEAGDDGNRQRRIGQRLHLGHRLADRDPARQIERECHRRKLARMVDRERAEALGEAGDGAQRDELARRTSGYRVPRAWRDRFDSDPAPGG